MNTAEFKGGTNPAKKTAPKPLTREQWIVIGIAGAVIAGVVTVYLLRKNGVKIPGLPAPDVATGAAAKVAAPAAAAAVVP